MPEHVYKTIEITGTSTSTIEDAVGTAVAKACESVNHVRWFEVTDIRGNIVNDKIQHWQVTIKLGFTLSEGKGE